MIVCVCIGVIAFCACWAAGVAVAYRDRCRQLEDQIRRMGGEPEPYEGSPDERR